MQGKVKERTVFVQNSVTLLRKRVHGQHEPIYSSFP
eukprot:COSAG06_NODE_1358_length_9722_cov_18.463473_6_plen_36_part_00